MKALRAFVPFAVLMACVSSAQAQDLAKWTRLPADWKGAQVADKNATLNADKWSFFRNEAAKYVGLSATATILEPAKQFAFFGQSWSAWPDPMFGDSGFEAALQIATGKDA